MEPAAVAPARSNVKRAVGLLQEASRDLARILDGVDVVGVLRVSDDASRADADGLIQTGAASYGAVDVVVIARPARGNLTTAANAAKETDHANGIGAARSPSGSGRATNRRTRL